MELDNETIRQTRRRLESGGRRSGLSRVGPDGPRSAIFGSKRKTSVWRLDTWETPTRLCLTYTLLFDSSLLVAAQFFHPPTIIAQMRYEYALESKGPGIVKGDSDVSLRPDEFHVWLASLDLPASEVVSLKGILADEEVKRAGRFHFEKDRDRFIVARGLLRKILGGYVGKEPRELRFRYNDYGKPELTDEAHGQNIYFNVSHSHGLALYAVTHHRGIGVDIELIRPDFADEKIAERFFSPREVATLRSLPKEVQARAFFNCWTRKEAYLKALGDGLSRPLGDFEVSLVPGEPAKLLRVGWDPAEMDHWSLQELEPAFGYVAAVAVEGQDCRIVYRQWHDDPPDNSV